MLTAHPEAVGGFAVFDGPGMGLVAAARTLGKEPANFTVTTVDLSLDSGLEIAGDRYLKGLGAQHPYDQGVAEGLAAVAALAGKEIPKYIGVPAEKVTKENVLEAYENVFHKEPPQELVDAANQ
jgi:ribose transport system substrate-binding protein